RATGPEVASRLPTGTGGEDRRDGTRWWSWPRGRSRMIRSRGGGAGQRVGQLGHLARPRPLGLPFGSQELDGSPVPQEGSLAFEPPADADLVVGALEVTHEHGQEMDPGGHVVGGGPAAGRVTPQAGGSDPGQQ